MRTESTRSDDGVEQAGRGRKVDVRHGSLVPRAGCSSALEPAVCLGPVHQVAAVDVFGLDEEGRDIELPVDDADDVAAVAERLAQETTHGDFAGLLFGLLTGDPQARLEAFCARDDLPCPTRGCVGGREGDAAPTAPVLALR
jgi:hypothetical protein